MKQYESELETLQKAVTEAEKNGDIREAAKWYHKIGVIHQKQYNYAKALAAFQKSL